MLAHDTHQGYEDVEPAGSPTAVPYAPAGAVDAKVVDARMAKAMSFAARFGSGWGRPFDAAAFLAARPQFEWMKEILETRPAQPWVVFRAGDRGGQTGAQAGARSSP